MAVILRSYTKNIMTIDQISQSYEGIWRKYDAIEQRLSTPLSERMLDLGNLRQGMKILDVATGRGNPAISAAKRVYPEGSVLGVDIDNSMLKIAREKALIEGVTNLELAVSNVETLDGVASYEFDVAFARWCLMYFGKPVEALRSIREKLAAGGLFVSAVWIDPANASFIELPRKVLSKISEIPQPDHDVPGTFYYADMQRLTRDLELAGFEIKHSETMEVEVIEVFSEQELIDWARVFGMSRMLRDLPLEVQLEWESELVVAAEPFRTNQGSIKLGGISRIVVAS